MKRKEQEGEPQKLQEEKKRSSIEGSDDNELERKLRLEKVVARK